MLGILEGALTASKSEFDDLLTRLPRGIDSLYERILSRSPDVKRAKKILHIVVAATMPLTLDEMNFSLAVEPYHKSIRDLEQDLLPPAGTENTLKEICGLFIRVIDSKIYLVHQTAKEFLIKDGETVCDNPSPGAWRHSLDPIESNYVIANICLSYLLLVDSKVDPAVISTPNRRLRLEVNHFPSRENFLGYAARNWTAHFQKAQIREGANLLEPALKVCNTDFKGFRAWFQIYWDDIFQGTYDIPGTSSRLTDLMVVSYLGLEAVVQLLLKRGADVYEWDIEYGSALNMAALGKQRGSARLLLDSGGIFYIGDLGYEELHKVIVLLDSRFIILGLALRMDCFASQKASEITPTCQRYS